MLRPDRDIERMYLCRKPIGRIVLIPTAFSQTTAGATASARLYSLVETARANGIEPHAYLSRLFADLPKAASADHFESLLPWNITRTLEGTK